MKTSDYLSAGSSNSISSLRLCFWLACSQLRSEHFISLCYAHPSAAKKKQMCNSFGIPCPSLNDNWNLCKLCCNLGSLKFDAHGVRPFATLCRLVLAAGVKKGIVAATKPEYTFDFACKLQEKVRSFLYNFMVRSLW